MESTPSCSRDPTDITADCPWKRVKNRMRCGPARRSAEGGLKIFRYRIVTIRLEPRGFGGIATLYSSRTKIGVASIVCDNPETRTVRLLFAEATCRPSVALRLSRRHVQ